MTVGSAPNGPEFSLAWVPKALQAVETGQSDLVSIAQVFQRSGTLSVSWKDNNITSPEQFKGKKVGVWDFGNEYEVTSGAKKYNLDVDKDYTKVIQDFDMIAFLAREIDVAEAMIYNEYAQVLEAKNPDTGALYQPDDINVIDWNTEGTAMLQDAVFARRRGWRSPATRTSRSSSCKARSAAGSTAATTPTNASTTSSASARRWQGPPGLADERGQPAHLAVAERHRHHRQGALGPDDQDRDRRRRAHGRPGRGRLRNDLAQKALDAIREDAKGASFRRAPATPTEGGN